MTRGTRSARIAAVVLGLAAATSLGCNAILGADDYKVGQASDGGDIGPGDTGGTGNDGTGGKSNDGTGGRGNDAAGGRGTGGRVGTGGATPPGAGGATPPGAGGASGGVDAFVGNWTTDAETLSTDCGDGMPTTDVGSDELDWATGPKAGTIQTFVAAASCTVVANVSGKVATLPKTTCMDTMGFTYVISGTFAIQADGSARLLETVTISMAGLTCIIDATGTFTML